MDVLLWLLYKPEERQKKKTTEANTPVPQEMCSTYGPSLDVFVIRKFKEIILACFLPLRDTVRQDAKPSKRTEQKRMPQIKSMTLCSARILKIGGYQSKLEEYFSIEPISFISKMKTRNI